MKITHKWDFIKVHANWARWRQFDGMIHDELVMESIQKAVDSRSVNECSQRWSCQARVYRYVARLTLARFCGTHWYDWSRASAQTSGKLVWSVRKPVVTAWHVGTKILKCSKFWSWVVHEQLTSNFRVVRT